VDALKSKLDRPEVFERLLSDECGRSQREIASSPARPRKPKDKVEGAVLIVQRWVLARIRRCTFFILDELNQAIWALMVELNERPFQKLEGCRRSAFETLELPALRPLPKGAIRIRRAPRPYREHRLSR
jgi:hypothetical protein